MGNWCVSSGSHNVYSPPDSPRTTSGASGSSHAIGGQNLTSVYQLSPSQREQFLNTHDPMRAIGLNSETPVYRTTESHYVRGGMLAGNPESCASIALHEELRPNPYASYIGASSHEARAYLPKQAHATDLGVPSLNVMVGSRARSAIQGYSHGNHVAVKMRLGDFLEKGGKVYSDISSAADNGETARALIVTLPRGKKVPVDII
ncbi:type III effector [Pseudomonas coronafaciens pv. porri]|uniref:Type III effector n=1 Tax=Pseudomonas coronafaciens pv. porri TaxID=83964 RepID=A0ABR5JT48_9PSED|nr:AvrPphF family type III effector [Pseudomonas coronafaciens]KOP60711.1 type III effector [Pseudomonas coronafaciens pv. porri]KPY22966.1 HopF [Pseudomonas coronafaciens pv. porri]RMU84553.1 Type III effector HopF2 [Pseudomonas coronafaciens pv. porri]RMW01397.1 HopF [Pseudomonas coronafaciens pv. porri]RMW12072.1 HopF [Pseudomonas coronafaciens pv. porri]